MEVTRTYDSLIRELGFTPCHGIMPTGHYCALTPEQHAQGEWTFTGSGLTIIHILDEPVLPATRRGTRRLLLLCARALDYTLNADHPEPLWRKVYRSNMAARALGKRLHIVIPARLHLNDRLIVWAGTAGLGNDVPLRKQASDWARR